MYKICTVLLKVQNEFQAFKIAILESQTTLVNSTSLKRATTNIHPSFNDDSSHVLEQFASPNKSYAHKEKNVNSSITSLTAS